MRQVLAFLVVLVTPALDDDGVEACKQRLPEALLVPARCALHEEIEGVGGALRQQRAENKDAGLGDFQEGRDRGRSRPALEQWIEGNHIGVLPERRAQRLCSGQYVDADFALDHEGAPAGVNERDRLFNGEHMPHLTLVDAVQERVQGGRLA